MKTLLFALLIICSSLPSGENDVSDIIRPQLETIRPGLEKAKADYAQKVKTENDKLCKLFEAALVKETKAGNLERALVIKEALGKAKSGGFVEDLLNPTASDLLAVAGTDAKAVVITCAATEAVNLNKLRIEDGILAYWTNGGIAEFKKPVGRGRYQVAVEVSTPGAIENTITVALGSAQAQAANIGSSGWNEFVWSDLGTITVSSAATEIRLSGTTKGRWVANLRTLRLTPVR